MDPLVVAGRVREQVHALLVDLEPLAVAEVLAERLAQLAGPLKRSRHRAPLSLQFGRARPRRVRGGA